MTRRYLQDIFSFANTALGRFFAIAIAVCLMFSLGGFALAADDGFDTFTTDPGASNGGGSITTDPADVKVGEAFVNLKLENCIVTYQGETFDENATGFKVPQDQPLEFNVAPVGGGQEYVIESISLQCGPDENILGAMEVVPQAEDGLPDYSGKGLCTVGLEDLALSPNITLTAKAIEPYPAPTLKLKNMERVYTGAVQPNYGYEIESSAEGLQNEDDEIVIEDFEVLAVDKGIVPGKDAGKHTIHVTKYWVKRPTAPGEDVTRLYQPIDLSQVEAELIIKKAPLFIVTPSATKPYDGTPLTYTGEGGVYDITDIPFLMEEYGHLKFYDGPIYLYDCYDHFTGDYITPTGSQTEVGASTNTVKIRDDVWEALQKNYDITTKYGTLRVTSPNNDVVITAPTENKMYDGKPLTVGTKDLLVDGLPKGFTVQAKVNNASRTDAGRSITSVDRSSVKVLDQNGKDVTNLYKGKLVFAEGELYIEPAVLLVTTYSATRSASGGALTAGGKMDGLVNGETATLQITGRQVGVGASLNTFNVAWNGTAKKSNYRVVGSNLGTLTVTADSNSGGSGSGSGGGSTGASPSNNASNGGGTSGNSAAASSAASEEGEGEASEAAADGIDPAIEKLAQGMQNFEQLLRGEETTGLIAPAVEEILSDNDTPLGVFDEPVDCWVHWYSILGLLATAIYGGVVMFFRRAYAYELESREANILGAPVGLAHPQIPAGTSGQAGREA